MESALVDRTGSDPVAVLPEPALPLRSAANGASAHTRGRRLPRPRVRGHAQDHSGQPQQRRRALPKRRPTTAKQVIGFRPADEQVSPVPADDHIRSGGSEKEVVVSAAAQSVVAVVTTDDIITRRRVNPIGARISDDDVGGWVAEDVLVRRGSHKRRLFAQASRSRTACMDAWIVQAQNPDVSLGVHGPCHHQPTLVVDDDVLRPIVSFQLDGQLSPVGEGLVKRPGRRVRRNCEIVVASQRPSKVASDEG